ncbi:hypothetical protein [Rufibacter sp. XAAS-G3-1]|nr:hypothetical protein [Rufibacter sp. XAAS-G3-1]
MRERRHASRHTRAAVEQYHRFLAGVWVRRGKQLRLLVSNKHFHFAHF